MGELNKIIKEESKGSILNYFKTNSTLFYNQYQKPDGKLTKNIDISSMNEGKFYFLYYKDDSNWMKLSPLFFIDYKQYENTKILFGINLNFIPLEIRANLFDLSYQKDNENCFNTINFESAYKMLLKYGYEYAIMEYDIRRIVQVLEIDFKESAKFIYSSHPANKYDPQKLYDIWYKKLSKREERHQAIMKANVDFFYNTNAEINEEMDILKGRKDRLEKGTQKYT